MKLSVQEEERRFRSCLDSINASLTAITNGGIFWGQIAQESAQKVIDGFDAQPPQVALEAAEGLSQLLCSLSARIADLEVLCNAIATKECVPLPVVRKIVDYVCADGKCSSNLPETLIPILPIEMRPE